MPESKRDNDDLFDALERMAPRPSGQPGKGDSAARRSAAPPADENIYRVAPEPPRAPTPPPILKPASRTEPGPANTSVMDDELAECAHCLNCGYRLQRESQFRCSECGQQHDPELLSAWFDGAEAKRFETVQFLILGNLLLKLFLILPQLMCMSKAAAGAAAGWACYLALRDRGDSVGGYLAIGGVAAAGMAVLFSAADPPIAYFTLDMVSGCLLVLALLQNPKSERRGAAAVRVWGSRGAKQTMGGLLFAIPVFAVICYALNGLWGGMVTGGTVTVPAALSSYSPFGFVLPFIAATVLWVYVLLIVRGFARKMFPKGDEAIE